MKTSKRLQTVMSEPQFSKSEPYKTKSGQVKTRKVFNENAKPVKTIFHSVI